jgi:hypothetical protein
MLIAGRHAVGSLHGTGSQNNCNLTAVATFCIESSW